MAVFKGQLPPSTRSNLRVLLKGPTTGSVNLSGTKSRRATRTVPSGVTATMASTTSSEARARPQELPAYDVAVRVERPQPYGRGAPQE